MMLASKVESEEGYATLSRRATDPRFDGQVHSDVTDPLRSPHIRGPGAARALEGEAGAVTAVAVTKVAAVAAADAV